MILFKQTICLALLVRTLYAQLFDFSEGKPDTVITPCSDGPGGRWTDEYASKYPGGPSKGLVHSADDPILGSCLETRDQIAITKASKLHILARVPLENSWNELVVWLVNKEGQNHWIRINGPVTPGEEWIEISEALPDLIEEGDYKLTIWDPPNIVVSLRYFEISENDRTSFPPDSTEVTTKLSTISSTVSTETSTVSTESLTQTSTELTTSESTNLSSEMSTEHTTQSSTSVSQTAASTESISKTTVTEDEIWTHPPATSPSPSASFSVSWWSVLLGVALGVLFSCLLFCSVTWCWWLVCVRYKPARFRDPELPNSLPRLAVSAAGSNISITGRSTNPSSYLDSKQSLRSVNWNFKRGELFKEH